MVLVKWRDSLNGEIKYNDFMTMEDARKWYIFVYKMPKNSTMEDIQKRAMEKKNGPMEIEII